MSKDRTRLSPWQGRTASVPTFPSGSDITPSKDGMSNWPFDANLPGFDAMNEAEASCSGGPKPCVGGRCCCGLVERYVPEGTDVSKKKRGVSVAQEN